MATIIAPLVARFTINATYGGENIANIVDVRIEEEGIGADRPDACEQQARDILHAWDDRILTFLTNDYVAQSVSWVDLDSADGSTGVVTTGGGDTWPKAGGNTTDQPTPGNVALLVTKVAPGGGRRTRNGRMYVAGISEALTDATNPGNVTTASLASLTAAFEGFSSDVSNTFLGEGYTSNMVVVHTINEGTETNPDIVYSGQSEVTGMVVQPRLATQRRRLRRK